MTKQLGIAYIKTPTLGLLASMPGAKLELGGVDRTPVMDRGKIVGYTEQQTPCKLNCQISLGLGGSLGLLRVATNENITFETDIGISYIIANAFLTKPPVLTAGGGGQIDLEFAGDPAQEMQSFGSSPNAF
jgi:hypothetical protein